MSSALFLDNVFGYATLENYARAYQDTVEDILAFLDGKPIRVLA
jgi:hypothetical protein